jgi:hypothetical protein
VKIYSAGIDVMKVVKIYTGLGGKVLMGGTGRVDTCGATGTYVNKVVGKAVGTYGDGIITTDGLAGMRTTDVTGTDVGKYEIGITTGE